MAGRETASVRFWLLGKHRNWKYFFKRIMRSHYLIQDNLLTPYNRLIGCRLGHKNIIKTEDGLICFACYRPVDIPRT